VWCPTTPRLLLWVDMRGCIHSCVLPMTAKLSAHLHFLLSRRDEVAHLRTAGDLAVRALFQFAISIEMVEQTSCLSFKRGALPMSEVCSGLVCGLAKIE
jgi:hypothetical protein